MFSHGVEAIIPYLRMKPYPTIRQKTKFKLLKKTALFRKIFSLQKIKK